jgi:hypothetical protein
MSYTSIPNQPILFNPANELGANCYCDPSEYKQIIDFNDDVYFQLEAPVCTEVYEGVGILDTEQNWTYEGTQICSAKTEDPNLQEGTWIWRFYPLNSLNIMFSTFKIVVEVTSMTQGYLNVYFPSGGTYTIYTAGTYEFYLNTFNLINGITTYLDLVFTSINFVGCFNEPQVYGVGTNINVGWVDSESLEIVSPAIIDYSYVNENKLTVHLAVNDQELIEGCYRLAITDPCDNSCGQYGLLFPNFEDPSYWLEELSSSPQWSVTPGLAVWYWENTFGYLDETLLYNISELPGLGFDLCEGVTYQVTVDIESITNGGISFVSGAGSVCVPALITTPGIHVVTLTVGTGSTNFAIKAETLLIPYAITTTIELNSVQVSPIAADIDYVQYSPTLSVGNYDDPCTYLKLSACNTYDQFGFAFNNSGFAPELRVEGLISQPQYKTDVDLFRFASGKTITSYADRLKSWSFHFGRLPEYLLDFLSVAFFFDNVNINGNKYAPADNEFPSIQWNEADNKLGRLDITLIEKKTKIQKVQCAAQTEDCVPLPPVLDDFAFQDGNLNLFQDSESFVFNP